ncbi:hypothetical protein tinsulaeT_03110 [Thalassotalea insulae]|uniref:Bacteriophage T5 Orf172 DNA-binding domain-containing protein n=1 Tax=Thalassotalea insulae TaxID=2056778 RepID=A0ABQ6GS64_9GAMM|nr:GIY-YIG nuclease family protein [Thalassotalea insulae]GLX76971.1 hypothetical protein tinsulaeT_03110 [Thalassotalea insulae]
MSNNDASKIRSASVTNGNVYVMTHSFFTDVVRIGCTPDDPEQYARQLSENTPGDYTLVFSLQCAQPCQVKKQIRAYLNAEKYVNEFYQVPPEVVKKLMQRETLKIPIKRG